MACLALAAYGRVVRCSLYLSSNCAVTFLIFLSRPAGTWIVPPDFRLAARDSLNFARFFACGRGPLVRTGELHAAAPSRCQSAALNFFRRFLCDNLQIEERSDSRGIDAIQHLLKQNKTLFLVFDQRIFLSVADQPDSLLHMIERQQVVLPLRVDNVEHDDAL